MQPKLIYDTIHGNIELSKLETILLKSSFINRLHQILQNSTAYLVFPSCKTSRFEHSLGVMQYSSSLFLHGLKNSSLTKKFLSDKSLVLLDLIEKNNDIFGTYYDKNIDEDKRPLVFPKYLRKTFGKEACSSTQCFTDKQHCQKLVKESYSLLGDVFIEKNIGLNNSNYKCQDKFTFLILFQTLRLYGLLHDIGHLPFSHIFEFTIESAKELYPEKKHSNQTMQKIKEIVDVDDKIHEAIGKNLTNLIIEEVERSICNEIDLNEESKLLRIFCLRCMKLCFEEIRKDKEVSRLASLSAIVDNTIDSDRLDFIQRDGYVSGVSKSAGNVERIIKLFHLTNNISSKNPEKYSFLPSIQSLHDIEKLLYDRYNVYRYMVNHHSVKRSDYILQKNIELQLTNELNEGRKSSNLITLDGVIDVIDIIHNIIKNNGSFFESKYSFTQLTDFWLLSFFSKKYFENLYNATTSQSQIDYQLSLLSEIYESKRSFNSLWKRIYNYKSFICDLAVDILKYDLDTSKLDFKKYSSASDKADRRRLFCLKELNDILVLEEKKEFKEKIGKLAIELISINNLGWCRKIEEYANNHVKEHGIIILVVKTNITDGLKPFNLVDNKDGKTIFPFNEMSSLPMTLKLEAENAMKFFVYYKSNQIENKNATKIYQLVNNAIRISIINIIKEIISNFATAKN